MVDWLSMSLEATRSMGVGKWRGDKPGCWGAGKVNTGQVQAAYKQRKLLSSER